MLGKKINKCSFFRSFAFLLFLGYCHHCSLHDITIVRKDFKMSNPNPGFYIVWQHQLVLAGHDLSKTTEQNLLYFAGLRVLSTHLIIIHEVLLRGLNF